MDDQFSLRRADISDINTLSQHSQKTFRETFIEDFSICYPQNNRDTYFRSSASSESFAKINNSKQTVRVTENKRNGELVTNAIAGPCDDIHHPDICLNQDGQLNQLYYIQRDQRNHGFGQKLMNVALSWLHKHYPRRPIWFTVLSQNFKVQKFYAYYDFNKVDEINYRVENWRDLEFIMKHQVHAS